MSLNCLDDKWRFPQFWIFSFICPDSALLQPSRSLAAPQFQHSSISCTICLGPFLLHWNKSYFTSSLAESLSSEWNWLLGSSTRPWASWFSSPQVIFSKYQARSAYYWSFTTASPFWGSLLTLLVLSFNILCPSHPGSVMSLLSVN